MQIAKGAIRFSRKDRQQFLSTLNKRVRYDEEYFWVIHQSQNNLDDERSIIEPINSLPASANLAMAAKARELKNQGVNVIGLSLGEPDFNTPDFIKEAAVQGVKDTIIHTPCRWLVER